MVPHHEQKRVVGRSAILKCTLFLAPTPQAPFWAKKPRLPGVVGSELGLALEVGLVGFGQADPKISIVPTIYY